jgi:1D-myo-inositol-tetrakisphosphate 5-kinase/inositol-polyphosphate multikinase
MACFLDGLSSLILLLCVRQFYGIERLRGGGEEDLTYLVLEDLTQGMRRPCVMDIKIGARTYGPDASPAKVRQEDAKYLGTKKPLGM